MLFASGRLTPPTKPILQTDDSLTFVPYRSASFISSAIFLDREFIALLHAILFALCIQSDQTQVCFSILMTGAPTPMFL